MDPESEDLLALAVIAARSMPGDAQSLRPPRMLMPPFPSRTRRDLCPGVLRPWPAEDGALVRVRLVGGRLTAAALIELAAVAASYGDGDLHLTARANLQLRGLPLEHGALPAEVVAAIERTGLLPSRAHDLARNVVVSPLTGLVGGRADLRPVASALDTGLVADPALGGLPGRFLFVLDDGRGDVLDRGVDSGVDLGLVALDANRAQLRHGSTGWGRIVPLADAPAALLDLARRFLDIRGDEVTAPWHVDELPVPLTDDDPRDPRTHVQADPPPYGPGHVAVPDGVLAPELVRRLTAPNHDLVVTPWRSVVVDSLTPTGATR